MSIRLHFVAGQDHPLKAPHVPVWLRSWWAVLVSHSLSVLARGRYIEGGGGRVRRGTGVTMVGLGRERGVDGIEVSR